jgi:hypothetical protein
MVQFSATMVLTFGKYLVGAASSFLQENRMAARARVVRN